jgi:hypothetical protein
VKSIATLAREKAEARIAAEAEAASQAAEKARGRKKARPAPAVLADMEPPAPRAGRRQPSPAARRKHFLIAASAGRVLAASGVDLQAMGDNDNGANQRERESAAAKVMLQLQEDQRRLKDIQSIEKKIALKAELLPTYGGWIDGVIKAGKVAPGPLDQVFTTLMAWRIDVGDFEGAMPMIEHALLLGLTMPDRFKRATPSFVVEQVADAAIRAYEAGEDAARNFPAAILPELEDLIELVDADIHDEITAKLHRALGLAVLAGARDDDAEDLTARQAQALRCYLRALELNERVGVKKDIEKLQRALKKAGAETDTPPPAAETSAQDGQGG